MSSDFVVRSLRPTCIALFVALVCLPTPAFAQVPWVRMATNLAQAFIEIARPLALVAIVLGGLTLMYGEGGAKRQFAGIAFGGGVALFATEFLTWLF
jgi:type IV secretory pathway VirB2 component (pilin)